MTADVKVCVDDVQEPLYRLESLLACLAMHETEFPAAEDRGRAR